MAVRYSYLAVDDDHRLVADWFAALKYETTVSERSDGTVIYFRTINRVSDIPNLPGSPMPTTETIERFIARVEQNAHVEAVQEFYTEDSSMQENQGVPRRGRDAHAENERKVMARAQSLTSECVRPVFVNGDRVVIRWIFKFHWQDGTSTHMEELAYQRWEGERIAEETFFYDPAQRVPKLRG